MKKTLAVLLALGIFPTGFVQAAYQSYPVKSRRTIIDENITRYEMHRDRVGFKVEVISDSDGTKYETIRKGRPFVGARNGENYSVRIYNPLPVRVAVNLSVDGLNSISGKPSGIEDGDKWMIEPYGTVVIRGWQVNGDEARRFFFTDKPKSYAKWRGDELNRDLSANCGVIGVAYFWSQEELDRYYGVHPIIRYSHMFLRKDRELSAARAKAMGAPAPATASGMMEEDKSENQQAGTGMGERELNPTRLVEFRYDAGMYRASDAVLIYYDFASPGPTPNPFPALSYAPEMP